MSYNKSKYYQDNLQHSIVDADKTPEKQLLVRNKMEYPERPTQNYDYMSGHQPSNSRPEQRGNHIAINFINNLIESLL